MADGLSNRRPLLWVGMAGSVVVPLAFLDQVNRFALLPQILSLQLVGLAGLIVWVLASRGTWRNSRLLLPVLIFFTLETLSVLVAENPVLSLLPIATHFSFLVYFIVLLNLENPEDFHIVLKVSSLTGGLASTIGLAQFLGWEPSWIPTAGLPSATMGHRNIAAAYMVGILPFTFLLWSEARNTRKIIFWGSVIGLQSAFLIATRSRGAWTGLGLGLVSIIVFYHLSSRGSKGPFRLLSHARTASLAVAVALCTLAAAVPAQIEKGSGEAMWEGKRSIGASLASVVRSGGDKGRLALWHRTLEMIADRPIMGVGAGNWRIVFPAYSEGDMMDPRATPHRPHNDVLWVWSEMGTVGLLAYLYMLWVAFGMVRRLLLEDGRRPLGLVLICSMTAALVNSLFSFPREFPAAWLPFVICLGGLALNSESDTRTGSRKHKWIVTWAILISIVAIGITVRQIAFDRYSVRYRIAFIQEQWSEVIHEVNQALAWGSFDEEAFLMRGRSYSAFGNNVRAQMDFRQGLAFHPNSVGLWNELGNTLRQSGDPDAAMDAYKKGLGLDPKSGMSYNNIGTLHAMSGAIDSARAAYEQAVANQPDMAEAHANLSNVHRRSGDLVAAFASANRALELAPGHPEACNALGSSYMVSSSYPAAEAQFANALLSDSTRAEIHYNLGRAREAQGRLDETVDAYEAFFRHWKGAETPRVRWLRQHLNTLEHGE